MARNFRTRLFGEIMSRDERRIARCPLRQVLLFYDTVQILLKNYSLFNRDDNIKVLILLYFTLILIKHVFKTMSVHKKPFNQIYVFVYKL